ncbi:MAG: hypothetical protein NTW54_04755 [Bacteroidetes bacterium]|nr:hypothetical protein [Bacteroidota bacterium]
MKNVIYLTLVVLLVFGGCKKKTPPTPTPTPDQTPTMNYVKFTINGKGLVNRTFIYSKAKNLVQRNEYSETTNGVIGAFFDISSGDTLIQMRFDENTTGNKPFNSGGVYFVFTNLNALHPLTATSTSGDYNVSSFTPTHLTTNTTSGLVKGTFKINATFSGILTDDVSTDTYTITGGELKLDGE